MSTDGSIRVGTKLETKEAEVDLKKLEKECEKTAEKIEQAGQKIKTVFTGASKGQLSSAFKTANKELQKTEAALEDIERQIAAIQAETNEKLPQAATDDQAATLLEMEQAQTGPLLKQREALSAKAAEYKRQMEGITAELNKQTQAESAQKALKTTGKEAASDAAWLSKIKTQEQYNAALSTTQTKMAAIERKAEEISRETGVAKDKLLQQDTEYQKLSRRLDLLKTKAKQMGTAGADAGKKTSKEMSKASKAANGLGNSLKKGIKQAGKMVLAVFGIRAAYNAVRRAANAYLEQNENLKNQMSSLWNIAGQAIGPFIETMIKGISTAVVWVNSLIKALTGVDLVAKANAAALKKQASATKEASKAAQLAGFDEINKLNDDTSSSGSNDAGIFDTSLVGNIPNFMEEIKKKLLANDFYGAGETLAKSLMEGIRNFNWQGAGETIGNILTGVLDFAFGFLLNLDLSDIMNGLIDMVCGFFDTVSNWLGNQDWKAIGSRIIEQIVDFFVNTDWGQFASSLAKFAGSAIGAIGAALVGAVKKIGEYLKKLWDSIVDYFSQYVDWGGTPGEIIAGLWAGIVDAFKNAGKWIYDHIWVPFRDGFKKAFGIASPSKEMKTMGGYIIDGLWGGIGDIWAKTKEKFTEWKTKLSTWFSTTKENIKTWGSDSINKFKDGIGNVWSKVSSKFTDAKNNIGDWAASLKERGKAAGDNFSSGLKNGLDTLKNKIKDPINAVIGFIEKALNWVIGKLNTLSWDIPNWVPLIGGKKFGFNMKEVSIPRLAQGGIVNNPGRGVPVIAGEAGAEAVLPLENNTEWMDTLAAKINAGVQKIVVPIYLNGRKIAEEVIDLTKQRTFATNGAI